MGFFFLFGHCIVVQYLVSFLVLQSLCWGGEGCEERAGCFALIVFLMSYGFKCSLYLPRGAVC